MGTVSIHVVRGADNRIEAHTICDDCKALIRLEPATEHQFPGTTLMVCNWCTQCSPKHSWPLNEPWHAVVGMGVGNLNAVSKVTLQT